MATLLFALPIKPGQTETIWMNSWHVRNTPCPVPTCQEFRKLSSEIRILKVLILIVLIVTNGYKLSSMPH